jgi:hypothetical protein
MPAVPRAESEAPPPPPCALCEAPAHDDVWDVPLCYQHISQWHRDCPGARALAGPEDVQEARPGAFGGPGMVLLHPGAEARLLAGWTASWASRLRAERSPKNETARPSFAVSR